MKTLTFLQAMTELKAGKTISSPTFPRELYMDELGILTVVAEDNAVFYIKLHVERFFEDKWFVVDHPKNTGQSPTSMNPRESQRMLELLLRTSSHGKWKFALEGPPLFTNESFVAITARSNDSETKHVIIKEHYQKPRPERTYELLLNTIAVHGLVRITEELLEYRKSNPMIVE